MKPEFETQVVDVDIKQIEEKLIKLGAKGGNRVLMKRWVFDIEKKEGDCSRWIRVRKEREQTKITYKEKTDGGITGTSEIEVVTDDFDKTAEIFQKIDGFLGKYYQENYRTQYLLDQGEVNIDEWPLIPPMLDIEGHSEKEVEELLSLLDLTGKDAGHIGHVRIYKKYGLDLHSIKELKF